MTRQIPLAPAIQILFLVIIQQFHVIEATANSVCQQPGYYSIRPCAQGCVGCSDSRADQIAFMIGCGHVSPNECWCAIDQFTMATSALKDCVSRSCTIGASWESDYSAAEAFYTSYCERAGFTHAGVSGAETTVAGDGTRSTTVLVGNEPPARTGTVDGGGTGGPGRSGPVTEDQGGGLSRSDKIALGVGIGLGLPATFAGIVTCVLQLRARSRRMAEGLPGRTVR
ncbi:hypothetical protein QBC37DRAFT_195609 [Rhypophila decipiens]|uniref:Extracellular membrane protein CFEM domain-containing protein n=1 Tax=Rhypophila decipiens TaxID=261697 RepID=A0AAN6Y6N9_9PEZI|nr:hypothetical protein QBC37DRAFT_195609 [Rhypophila decipiens]